MAIHRIKNKKEYVTMAKYHFKDYELSWKAKGILSLMLSLPDDWEFSYKGLAAMAGDSIDSLRNGLKELESKGYVVLSNYRDKRGLYKCIWDVYEKPIQVGLTESDKPNRINQAGLTESDKPTQLNNK